MKNKGPINFRVGERQTDGKNVSDLWHSWNTGSYTFVGKSSSEVHSLNRDDGEMLQVFENINLKFEMENVDLLQKNICCLLINSTILLWMVH